MFKHLVVFLACTVSFGAAWAQAHAPSHMDVWCGEDGPVEWIQVVLYLWAAALLLHAGRGRGIGWWGYAVVFVLVACEEVSWGQRLFDLKTPPAIAAINMQGELTVHNLVWFQQRNQGFGFLGYFALCLGVPFAPRYVPPLRGVYARLAPALFPAWLLPLPATGFMLALLPRLITHRVFSNLDEVGELYVAAGFFGFAVSSWMEVKVGSLVQEA